MRVLEPIWHQKPETAKRVRGRVELVLDWAKTRGYRDGDNPARWKGHIQNLLPKREKLSAVKHHPALPYREVAELIAELRQHDSAGARALELLILTAARTSEVLAARWSEFEPLEARLWTIPAARMKGGKEHRVPLSDAAMAILERQQATRSNDYVFPGTSGAQHAGPNTLSQTLQRLGRSDVTTHGFRSTFSDWCAGHGFPADVKEMALAHTRGAVEGAYTRTPIVARRRALAEAWARYCAGGAEVVELAEVRSA